MLSRTQRIGLTGRADREGRLRHSAKTANESRHRRTRGRLRAVTRRSPCAPCGPALPADRARFAPATLPRRNAIGCGLASAARRGALPVDVPGLAALDESGDAPVR